MWKYSFSQINNYLMCPYGYYLNYIKGIKEKTNERLYFGKIIHKGFAQLLTGTAFDKVTEETFYKIQAPDEEFTWETPQTEYIDRSDRIYQSFVKNFIHLQPDKIEETVEKEVNGFSLLGIVDAYFNSGTLTDWKIVSKFSKKSPLQMVFYSLMLPVTLGKYISFNPQGKYQGQEVLIEKEKLFYEKQIYETIGLIEASIFPKNAPDWKCSEKYCQFYDHCHKGKDIYFTKEKQNV